MNLINCLDFTQQIVKVIFQSKYKSKVDTNYNIECSQVRKKWNSNGQNHLIIQFYLKRHMKSYLVEEWNVICLQQQLQENEMVDLDNCIQLAKSTPLRQKLDSEIDHVIHLNENKRADWTDPQLIKTEQILVTNKVTINVAYLETLIQIEKYEQEQFDEFKSFKRDRYLSEEIQENRHLRKTSDLDGLRQYKKNKAIIDKVKNRLNDSCSSNSSRNKSFQLLTIINKKDDVEILSSPEDAQKIIDQGENADFEIQMIIDEQPIEKGQTIIIKSQSQQNPLLDFINQIRSKDSRQYSIQLIETMNFIYSSC